MEEMNMGKDQVKPLAVEKYEKWMNTNRRATRMAPAMLETLKGSARELESVVVGSSIHRPEFRRVLHVLNRMMGMIAAVEGVTVHELLNGKDHE